MAENPGTLAAAASSSMGSPAATTDQATKIGELIKMLTSSSQGMGMPEGTPLTSMQLTPGQPSAPPRMQSGQANYVTGEFATSGGRKRAESAALMSTIGDMTRKAVDYLHQKKVRDMSMTVEKLMTAYTGMQQAQASGDQEALKQNQDIINDITTDPKKVKMLQKAFDVKLLGDEKGKKTPEHQGLLKALGDWQKGGKQGLNPIAQNLEKSMPKTQQISPQMQALTQLIKDKVIPDANEKLKAQTETQKEIAGILKQGWTDESKERIADTLAKAKDVASQRAVIRTVMQEQGRLGAAEIMGRARVKGAQTMAGAMLQSTQWRMAGQVLTQQVRNKGTATQNKMIENLSKEHQRITDDIKDKEKQLAGLSDTWQTIRGVVGATNKAGQIQQDLMNLRKQQSAIVDKMGKLNFGESDPSSGDSGQDNSATDFDKLFDDSSSELLKDQSTTDE